MTTKGKEKPVAAKKVTTANVAREPKFSQEEMETHISFDLVDRKWNAWSSIKKDIAKMKRQGWELIKTDHYNDGTVCSCTFEAPENALTFRSLKATTKKAKKTGKPLSEEQKEKMRLGRLAKKEADAKAAEKVKATA